MRTNIDIDDELMAETMKATRQKTKKAAVEEAMREYLRSMHMRSFIQEMRGMGWEGNLDQMRMGREFAEDGTPFDETK